MVGLESSSSQTEAAFEIVDGKSTANNATKHMAIALTLSVPYGGKTGGSAVLTGSSNNIMAKEYIDKYSEILIDSLFPADPVKKIFFIFIIGYSLSTKPKTNKTNLGKICISVLPSSQTCRKPLLLKRIITCIANINWWCISLFQLFSYFHANGAKSPLTYATWMATCLPLSAIAVLLVFVWLQLYHIGWRSVRLEVM